MGWLDDAVYYDLLDDNKTDEELAEYLIRQHDKNTSFEEKWCKEKGKKFNGTYATDEHKKILIAFLKMNREVLRLCAIADE